MKICYIANPNHVGIQSRVMYFATKGYKVSLISVLPLEKNIAKSLSRHIKIYTLSKRSYKEIIKDRVYPFKKNIPYLKRLIHEIQPDIVHAYYIYGYGWLAALSNFQPYVVTAMNADILFYKKMGKEDKLLTFYTLQRADKIISVSKYIKQVITGLGISPLKNYVIWRGVDTLRFHPDIDVSTLRKRLNLNDSSHTIFSPRNFQGIYNIHTIIEAIPLVLSRFPKARFIFASNKVDNSDYEFFLRKRVRELKISDAVRFVGFIKQEQMPDYYNLAKICISIPSADGTPGSLHEAMACGCPPLLSDLPSAREWIKEGRNGVLVPAGNVKETSRGIIRLLNEKQKRIKEMAEYNRQLVKKKADFNKSMQKIEKIYRSAVKLKGVGS